MSEPKKTAQVSAHNKSLDAMIRSTDHILTGSIEEAHKAVGEMIHFHEQHLSELRASGMHAEVDKCIKEVGPYVNETKKILDQVSSARRMTKKSETATDGGAEMKKAVIYGMKPPTPSIGYNPKYEYRLHSELSPNEKNNLQYAGGNNEKYMYPFHSGALQHSGRILIPENPTPGHPAYSRKAAFPSSSDQSVPAMPDHHKRDSSVLIHSPGSPYHGKPGIVMGHNPQMPGHIPVKVAAKGQISTQFFKPEQVQPRKPRPETAKPIGSQQVKKTEESVDAGRLVLINLKRKLAGKNE